MKEYFMGLLALCVCICVVELLTPAGEGEGIARHLKLLCAICLLSVLVTPLLSLLQGGEGLPERLEEWLGEWTEGSEEKREEYGDLWEEQCDRMDIAYAEDAVAAMISQQFSVPKGDVRVEITVSPQGTGIESVRVALTGKAIWINTHEVEEYIRLALGCESSIYIE